METVINGLKTFLRSRSSNSAVDFNQSQVYFNVKLSARIKIPCDILSRIIDSNDWLQEMQFLDVRFQEEGNNTDFPFRNKPTQFNVAFKQSDGSQRCMEFQNGTQSKNIIIKRSIIDSLATEEAQQSEDGNGVEVLPAVVHQDHKLAFKDEFSKIQDGIITDTGIYVDVADDANDIVKEEFKNNMNTSAENSGISESFGNAENDAKDGSKNTLLDDGDDEDFDSSIIEDEVQNGDSDESWNPDENNGTENVIRQKTKSPRGKRKKNLVVIKKDADFTKIDSETKIKKKRTRKSAAIEGCEEMETSNTSYKSKRTDTGIYVDVADDTNDIVKEEFENNMNTSAENSGISESFGNAENNAKDGSKNTLLDDDDEDFDSSIIEDEVQNGDSDESWNPDENNGTENVIRQKTKSPRGKRKKNLVVIKKDADFTKIDSETKIKKKRTRKSAAIEGCEEIETSNTSFKSKRRRSSRKKSQVVEKEDSEFEDQEEISEIKKVKKKWEKNKVSCEHCGEQFDQIRAFNIHVETHTNSLETQNAADAKVDSVMRLDATQIEILEAEIEEKEDNIGLHKQNEVIEIKLVEISGESGKKVGQEELSEGAELLNNSDEILKKQSFSETSNLKEQNIVNYGTPSSNMSQKVAKKDYDVLCCCFCEKKFGAISQYNKHIQNHSSERPFVCDLCQGTYKTKETLGMHKANVHHKKRFSCESCDRSYKYKISLQRHFTSNHKLVKPHICHICGKDYYSKSSLVDHIARHSKLKPFKCNVCDHYYHSEKLLSQHSALHVAVLKHQCDQCGKSFRNIGKLKRHLEQHASKRSYVCEICQMAFTLKRYYSRHMITHDPLRAFYKCEACFKQFANKTNLDRHKLTFHSDAKPFQCNVCSKAFKLKSLLDQHARVHKEEKDYSCKFCKKTFSFNSSLHSHIKNHHKDEVKTESKTPEATFKCKICDNLFYSKSALVSHYTFHQS